MWKLTGFDKGAVASVYPKEVGLTYSAKTTHVEAELCRDPNCPVRHIFPIDIVFSVRNKGPRKKWTLREEDTLEKRHMGELTAPADVADSDIPAEIRWKGLQSLMQKQGAYLKPGELHRYWRIIEQRKMVRQLLPGEGDGLIAGTVEIYAQAFEHLMFDSAYFNALRECQRTGTISDSLAGTEKFRVGDTCPIVPGFLSPELRAQWFEDFTALTSYALEKRLGTEDDLPQSLGMQSTDEDILSEVMRNLQKGASKPRKARKPPSHTASSPSPPSKADTQRDANKQLYQANKELASANAAMEAKLDRIRATLGSLTTKMEDKTGEKVAESEPAERVSDALRLLLLWHSENNGDNKENDSSEVTLLSNQLQKLNAANEKLQTELVGLQEQLKEIRQQKKDRVKTEKKK